MSEKILFVDDDPHLLAAFQRSLRKQFSFDVAGGPREALEHLQNHGPYAVVVADMRMPGMDGVKLLEHMQHLAPDTVRVMLTGNAEQQTAVDAVNRGQVFRFLNKPCPTEMLVPTLQAALKQYHLIRTEREVLEGTLTGSINALAEILGMAAPEAHGRGLSLRTVMREFATAVGAGPLWELEIAALLSPIGFASVPPDVLRKVAARITLTIEEADMVQRVPQVGHDLLQGIPRLGNIAQIIRFQSKHFDGSGFPHEICSGAAIPVGARLLKIMLDRVTLEADGTYGAAARYAMNERSGHYDPELLEKCFERFPSVLIDPSDHERPPLALTAAELQPGQRLYSKLQTTNGLVLAAAGQTLTRLMIERLRNLAEIGGVREPFLVCDDPRTAAVARQVTSS
jgi:response regulator RpfG family c-di-GMP phosphodiesterase